MGHPGRTGRPFDRQITRDLLRAAEQVMDHEGYSGLSIDGLAKSIGRNRAAVYRRYPSVSHVAFAVITQRFGDQPGLNGISLAEDILRLQLADVEMFSSLLIRKNLPGLLETMRTDSTIRDLYREHFISPRRQRIAMAVGAAAARKEIMPNRVDVDLVCDLLLGPLVVRTTLPVPGTVDESLAVSTVDAATAYIWSVAT